jgi:hypothetical protein
MEGVCLPTILNHQDVSYSLYIIFIIPIYILSVSLSVEIAVVVVPGYLGMAVSLPFSISDGNTTTKETTKPI